MIMELHQNMGWFMARVIVLLRIATGCSRPAPGTSRRAGCENQIADRITACCESFGKRT